MPGVCAVLGMAGRERAELAEALDLLDRHLRIAEEIKQRIEQHRAVAGGEHEAVAVGPGRIGGIEFEKLAEQHGRDIGRAHRQAGMPGLGLLDGVHRQRADGVRHAIVLGAGPRCSARIGGRGKAGAGARVALAAGRRSGLVIGIGQSRRSARAAVMGAVGAVVGTGWAQITWGAHQSIPRRPAASVMHRPQHAPLTVSRDTT